MKTETSHFKDTVFQMVKFRIRISIPRMVFSGESRDTYFFVNNKQRVSLPKPEIR
ncbi:hypothetical protein M109_3169 [Bacteroides fragilis str. 3397 N2]|nr:hypothetical protein M109_3169 [Bacteroides fragilis str. 3397 N2]EYA42534.1 hypothetical protein M110_3294 [Bacteroides fragilis str. 3397 N3]